MAPPSHRINLLRGWPAVEHLPAQLLSSAAQRVLADPAVYGTILQYGPDIGYQPLREALADWLSTHFNVSRDAERICISGGASQNIARILQAFTDPAYTRAIWLVAPTYHLGCQIFEDGGFVGRLRGYPEDDEGVDLAVLEEKIRKTNEEAQANAEIKPYKSPGKNHKFYRHVIYCVPTCSNPSGKTMSLNRREGLVRLARKYDALIICDDVYDPLQWPLEGSAEDLDHPEARLPRLCDIDRAMGQAPDDPQGFGYAVSNGSFSKLAGPGVRTGWLEGSRAFAYGLSQLGSTKSGGSPSQLVAVMLGELLRSGELQEFLSKTVRPALQRRHRLLMNAVHEHLMPLGVRGREASLVNGSTYGGYFVWLDLPDGLSSRLVGDVAREEENVIIGNGSMFEVWGDENGYRFDGQIRLTLASAPEEELAEGVKRLAQAIKSIQENPAKYEGMKAGDNESLISSCK